MTCLQQWVVTITVTCSGYIPWLLWTATEVTKIWLKKLWCFAVVHISSQIFGNSVNSWTQAKAIRNWATALSVLSQTSGRMHCNSDSYKNQLWQSVNRLVEYLEYVTALGGHPIAKWSVTLTQSTSWSNEFARSLHVCMPGTIQLSWECGFPWRRHMQHIHYY